MMEQRVYGPVPWDIRYSLADWLHKQSKVERYKLHIPDGNNPEYVYITFINKATAQDKARIGRTLAWDGLRRQKQLETMDYEPKQRWHCTHCDPDGRQDQPHDIIARDHEDDSIKTKCCRCGRETWR